MRDLFGVLVLFTLACGDTAPGVPYHAPCAGAPYAPNSSDLSLGDVLHLEPDAPPTPVWDASRDVAVDRSVLPQCTPYGARRPCESGEQGLCVEGVAICLEQAWSECIQQVFPRVERCDALDNDCDGISDEGLQHPCYTADHITLKVGPCTGGVRTCVAGEFGGCVGEVTPQDEVCDLLDNDCDGTVDEGVTNACGICGPDLPELCNFEDEDCDGRIDEGAGNCHCDNPLYVPQPEVCNGEDEDCDGRVDEGPAGGPLVRFCATNAEGIVESFERVEEGPQYEGGECRVGLAFCSDQGGIHGYFECLQEVRPRFERCNGFDDDCDGVVDEAFEQGRVAVLFVVDVSGSMSLDELTEAFVSTQQAVEALHAQQVVSVCYTLSVVGTDAVRDPLLIHPADDCVEGVQDPPQIPRRDLVTAIASLRSLIDENRVPRGGARENTLDAMGNWFQDDLVDVDQDGELDDHVWFSSDPENPNKSVNLMNTPHRIVVILGDEEAQGEHWTAQEVADAMRQVGGVAYILGPSDARVRESYNPIVAAGGLYLVMRDPVQQEEGAVANGIRQAVDELACLAGEE